VKCKKNFIPLPLYNPPKKGGWEGVLKNLTPNPLLIKERVKFKLLHRIFL